MMVSAGVGMIESELVVAAVMVAMAKSLLLEAKSLMNYQRNEINS
jgi:hypothetical protein